MGLRHLPILKFGYTLYHGWCTLSDSATSTYEKEATGEEPLYSKEGRWNGNRPYDPHDGYMLTARKGYQHGRRTAREKLPNGDEKFAAITPANTVTSPDGSRREYSSDPTRCGGRKRTIAFGDKQPSDASGSVDTRCGADLNPQRRINALVDKTVIDDAISLLLESLAPATRSTYLRSWNFWQEYCNARPISPCVNMNEHGWGSNLLSFLTWEHKVMGNGGSTIASRFSAIRHMHMMEGRGDFDGKAYRVRALIGDVSRKKRYTKNILPTLNC